MVDATTLLQSESQDILRYDNIPKFSADDFYRFCQQLTIALGEDNCSLSVASDGTQRTFQHILRKSDSLGLNSQQVQQLKSLKDRYDVEQFEAFTQLKQTRCAIGETDENLYQLIHDSLCADILIIGTQQRMIPKLLANYADRARPPILIVFVAFFLLAQLRAVSLFRSIESQHHSSFARSVG